MPALESDLRRQLENVIIQARDVAESAARSALQKRAVDVAEAFPHFGRQEKDLRTRLRARGRQAGDVRNADKTQSIDQLTQELAYEYWHRMLFARFLAENNLLMHPDGVAVSLEECEELAGDATPPAPNGFVLAARFASTMLPEIFRTDDVLLEIEFAPEQRLALEKLLASLPKKTLLADDSLGWVYQFWQSKKKEEVNKSGAKIDGRTLSAVTQLFTEHYMVEFLLHNTIGAWWCARNGVRQAFLPDILAKVRLESLTYLRWRDDTTPAAGTFEGWPKTLAEFTMLDPCCGSGHFLVAAFNLLVPLRMHDEGLTAEKACEAVLRDNLFGLELDPRCTQIAAFALALAAWKYPDAGGYRQLPSLNIACSGQGVVGSKTDWIKFANGDNNFTAALGFLYDEFQKAPTLGSLINPRAIAESIFQTGFAPLRGSLDRALRQAETRADPDRAAVGVAAQGIAVAASLMARQFSLVATNVPYLARGKQDETMRAYLSDKHSAAKADLATAFVERCLEYCVEGGSTALVTPQNWLFLGSYKGLREWTLRQVTWNLVALLGEEAWWIFGIRGPRTILTIHSTAEPLVAHNFVGLDVSGPKVPSEKAIQLAHGPANRVFQSDQLRNPDARVALGSVESVTLLGVLSNAYQGIKTGDDERLTRCYWEVPTRQDRWRLLQSTVEQTIPHGGCEFVLDWANEGSDMARLQGISAWGKPGIAVSQMRVLAVALYSGEVFDSNVSPVVPHEPAHLPAIWCFCKSPEYSAAVRRIDQKVNVTNATLVKVPFDLERWQKVAAKEYPNGLPEPHSDDPTQWLFKGHPKGSTDPLQVSVARLLGYRWPDQEPDELDALADKDGIVPIPGLRGEPPAAERLHEVLSAALSFARRDPRRPSGEGEAPSEPASALGSHGGSPPGDVSGGSPQSINPVARLGKGEPPGEPRHHAARTEPRPPGTAQGHFVGPVLQPDARENVAEPAAGANQEKDQEAGVESLIYKLLTDAGGRPGTSLDDWLRDSFFEQHCKRFHNRPFLWHIWDGRKDGFCCLVNYHKLDHKALENLTYSYLGDWITAQKSDKVGADLRLATAQALQDKLKLILAGEPPYDIFVRWKPLHEQAIGWNPDLNDGVRMNIRPFMTAGVLRKNPSIKWTKDRGSEPTRDKDDFPWFWKDGTFTGDRVNDVHLTIAEKRAAREKTHKK